MVHFADSVDRVDKFNGNCDSADIMDAVSYFINGGTDYERPLNTACDAIREDKDFKQADIVFITDGCCQVTDGWLEQFLIAKKKWQFSVISVVIQDDSSVCKKFSDKVVEINSISEDGEALDAMFTI